MACTNIQLILFNGRNLMMSDGDQAQVDMEANQQDQEEVEA